MRNVAFLATWMANLPSGSVATPLDVPCSKTEAPMTGSLRSSVTVPSTLTFCAKAAKDNSKTKGRSTSRFITDKFLFTFIVRQI